MTQATSPSVTLIGTGAVRAHPTRGGASFLLEIAGEKLLFDCGRLAVHNLNRLGVTTDRIDRVLITHLHFDHLTDLPLLVLLSWVHGRDRSLPVHGPIGIAEFLEYGVRKAFAPDIQSRLDHGRDPAGLAWEALEMAEEGVLLETPDYTIDTLRTNHAGLLNFSFRIKTASQTIVITSDSEADPRFIEFCRDADLVLIECSGTQDFYDSQQWGTWHMTPEQIGKIANEASIKKLVLKHLVIESFSKDPNISESMAQTIRELHPTGEVLVGADGMTIPL